MLNFENLSRASTADQIDDPVSADRLTRPKAHSLVILRNVKKIANTTTNVTNPVSTSFWNAH